MLSRSIVRRPPSLVTSRPARRPLFGWTFPTPTDLPLAGTADGSGPPFVLIGQIILGLPALLWTYKCAMMVLFQRRIIYMPSIPPGTRNETLDKEGMHAVTKVQLSGLEWKEVEVESSAKSRWLRRPVKLRGIELEQPSALEKAEHQGVHVAVLYLQGNAGTPLLRLPVFRRLLAPDPKQMRGKLSDSLPPPRLTLLAVAPRSFWLSTRSKPTQPALIADYTSALELLHRTHPNAKIILYGHSLGGACTLHIAEHLRRSTAEGAPQIAGVVVENPMPSIPTMVRALYPQRWLPYHYLGPLAFDKWDSIELMRATGREAKPRVPSLWLRSGRDELIEEAGMREMHEAYRDGRDGEDKWVVAEGALHDTAYTDKKWRDEMRAFVARVAEMRDGPY